MNYAGCPRCGAEQGVIFGPSGKVIACENCERHAYERELAVKREARSVELREREVRRETVDIYTKAAALAISAVALLRSWVRGPRKSKDGISPDPVSGESDIRIRSLESPSAFSAPLRPDFLLGGDNCPSELIPPENEIILYPDLPDSAGRDQFDGGGI